MKRTDMACDFLPQQKDSSRYLRAYTVTVDKALSDKLNRPQGRYSTVECRAVYDRRLGEYSNVINKIAAAISELLPSYKSVLIVGLGNSELTADSLGARTCSAVNSVKGDNNRIYTVAPGVAGVTGIESFDVVAGIVSRIKPSAVIAVDSLASSAVDRIASAFQVTDTGITPGSGVSNHRIRLCSDTLGVPVISVGVPLVVYASTIIEDATGNECENCEVGELIVTPKDIDVFVKDCSEIIARAIIKAAAA